jgi:hypothetical protein
MSGLESKSFSDPDEHRDFVDKGRVDLVFIGGTTVGKATYEPGWQWSKHVGPIVGSEICQATHLGVVLSGRQRIRLTDGTEREIGPGEVFHIPPGHDGWAVGAEPCVVVDFVGMTALRADAPDGPPTTSDEPDGGAPTLG